MKKRVRNLFPAGLFAIMVLVFPLAAIARLFRRRIRSLWAGTPIITVPIKAKSERLLGVDARTLVYETYFITDAFDYNLERWMRRRFVRTIVQVAVFCWACVRFDRFHFFCNRGLLPQLVEHEFNPAELLWYRRLKKEVFFWSYGGDVRTQRTARRLGQFNCCTNCPDPGRFCICDSAKAARNYRNIQQYATAVFSMGDMRHDAPGSITDAWYWPVDLELAKFQLNSSLAPREQDSLSPLPKGEGGRPLRIVHAPNHREFKGTRYLIEAVDRLRACGAAVELTLVEGVANDRAVELYRAADVVFDQCLIGFYGYLSLEGMALGKAVICYMRDPQQDLLAPDECPIISASPPEIESALRRLIDDRQLVRDLGERGRRYIEKHHTPQAFARRLWKCYERMGVK